MAKFLSEVNVLASQGVIGDGVHDDTVGLQAALDSGAAVIRFAKPTKWYSVRRPLRVHSGQTILADPSAVVRLADGADCVLLTNADHDAGNASITIEGGVWDGNNANQTLHDFSNAQLRYDPARHVGLVLMFDRVRRLRLANLTIKDPESFGVTLGHVEHFTVENIRFDYNLLRLNMDGIHVLGQCRFGRITNLHGATNDDMVALNADDGPIAEFARGPISDVVIDGLFAENGYTGVRLLSCGSPVRRVHIANVFGTYRYNAVSFTHHDVHPGEPSTFEDVVIENVFCSKPTEPTHRPTEWDAWAVKTNPLVWFAPGTHTTHATIRNLHRTERAVTGAPTICVDENATVDVLAIDHVTTAHHGDSPVELLVRKGTIGTLAMTNVF
jgi:polygalacturonase